MSMQDDLAEVVRQMREYPIASHHIMATWANTIEQHRAEIQRNAEELSDLRAKYDALRARVDGAPIGQSLGVVVYYDKGMKAERDAAKLDGKRVALVLLDEVKP